MKTPRILLSLSLIVALGCTWILGCGGEDPAGPPPIPSPTEQVDGTVDLPEGWTGDMATLAVVNSLGTSTCGGSGGFSAECFRDDRQLVAVKGTAGPLLMAWFGEATPAINTRTTAEVLLWHALGSWMLPADGRAGLRAAIADLTTELDALVAALDQALLAHQNGLPASNPAVHQALQELVDSLLADAGADKGVIIAPSEMQSGVEVLNEGGINKITIKNSYRRRGIGYIWEETWTDENDLQHTSELDDPVYYFEIPPVDGFSGSINTILGYFFGVLPYEPKLTQPYTLPVHEGAKETEYAFDLLGFGLEPIADPSQYTSEELAQGEWIALKGLVLDYFFPFLTNLSGALSTDGPFDDVVGSDLAATFNSYLQSINTMAEFRTAWVADDWWGCVLALMNSAAFNEQFQEDTVEMVTLALLSAGMNVAQIDDLMDVVDSFFKAAELVDVIGGLTDNIIAGVHFQECEDANTWEVTVTSPVIHLEPREATIETHHSQLLTCVLDDDTGGPPTGVSYAYRWSCAGETGLLINPAHPADTSNDFLTSYDYVQYQADRGVAGVEEVTCAVYYKVGADTTFIADDSMTLTVTKREIVLQDTLSFCGADEITLTPTLEPAYTGDEVVVWAWRSSGSAGELSGPSGQTGSWDLESDSSATYASDASGGTGLLTCIASRDIDGTISPVDTAFVYVNVGAQDTYSGELYGYSFYDAELGYCGDTIYVRFAKVGGATGYSVYGYNYQDFWYNYFGDHFNRSGPPWPPSSYETDSEVFIWMSGGGGNCDGPNPDSLAWGLSRFEGVIIEVTPNCP